LSKPHTARYPERAPIDAYGNGGFRFADMGHGGSILIIASGIYAWDPLDADKLVAEDFASAFNEADQLEFLLLGTGRKQVFPSQTLKTAFEDAGMGLEAMDTGAACRTYNVLLAEGRDFAAGLIAVS